MGQVHGLAILFNLKILRHRFQLGLIGLPLGLRFVDNFLGLVRTCTVFGFFGLGQFALSIGNRAFGGINRLLQMGIRSLQRH